MDKVNYALKGELPSALNNGFKIKHTIKGVHEQQPWEQWHVTQGGRSLEGTLCNIRTKIPLRYNQIIRFIRLGYNETTIL